MGGPGWRGQPLRRAGRSSSVPRCCHNRPGLRCSFVLVTVASVSVWLELRDHCCKSLTFARSPFPGPLAAESGILFRFYRICTPGHFCIALIFFYPQTWDIQAEEKAPGAHFDVIPRAPWFLISPTSLHVSVFFGLFRIYWAAFLVMLSRGSRKGTSTSCLQKWKFQLLIFNLALSFSGYFTSSNFWQFLLGRGTSC